MLVIIIQRMKRLSPCDSVNNIGKGSGGNCFVFLFEVCQSKAEILGEQAWQTPRISRGFILSLTPEVVCFIQPVTVRVSEYWMASVFCLLQEHPV